MAIDCKALKVGLRLNVVPGDRRNGMLQTKLSERVGTKNKRYYIGRIDNIFGSMTQTAVKNYQRDNKLVVDGIAGPITLEKLGLCNKPVITPSKPNLNTPSQDKKKNELFSFVLAQPDAYTCGPTSLAMAFSVVDVVKTKSAGKDAINTLSRISGTNKNGTTPENLDASANKFNKNYKMFMVKYENLNSFKKYIDAGQPIVLHIGTIPELGYINYYGHYIIVLGYDYNTNMVKIIDPSRTGNGAKWYHLNVIKKAINRRNHPTPIHPLVKV